MLKVIQAKSSKDFQAAKEVLGGFPDHQRMCYASDIHIVERYFDDVAYNYEMDNLQKVYANSGGAVIVAFENDVPVGGVCLNKLDNNYCEMKRLFVPVAQRRKGIGKLLTDELLTCARAKHFKFMRLDTGTFMVESHRLYEKLGFKRIEAYYQVEQPLRDGLYFMELKL